MNDNTNWTPFPDDNLLGLTDKNSINEFEAKGIAKAELFIFGLDTELSFSSNLILDIHKIAFEELYDWAGKWRTVNFRVGNLIPPEPSQILPFVYQFIDNLNYKLSIEQTKEISIETLVYCHYEFIRIHPFNNGNGRTGRLLMNLVALKLGYKPLGLYSRKGESRVAYITAMQQADKGNYELLSSLVRQELQTF
jgi:cell filamentation protein